MGCVSFVKPACCRAGSEETLRQEVMAPLHLGYDSPLVSSRTPGLGSSVTGGWVNRNAQQRQRAEPRAARCDPVLLFCS